MGNKTQLEFWKEDNDAVFFRDVVQDRTLDVPKYHTAFTNGELREFVVEPDGEYYFEFVEDFESLTFTGRVGNQIIFFTIDEDGQIDNTYIYRINQRAQ